MGWAKFDDQFTDHPKVQSAGPMAELLAMRAVIYSARYETDGLIREAALPRLTLGITAPKRQIEALLRENLWEKCSEGWRIHDFLDYHPSKEDREAERQAARERMRNVRANKPRSSDEVPERFEKRSPYPDPTPTSKEAAASAPRSDFDVFHSNRAAAEVLRQKNAGTAVMNAPGLATAIAKRPDFIEESQRLWAHRDCETCGGEGFTEVYAPGRGQVQIPCEAT